MSDSFLFPHHEECRFAPSILLRTALFGALPPGKARKVCATNIPSEIASVSGIYIAMRDGSVFDQCDLDVLLAIINEVAIREEDVGMPVTELSLPMRGLLFALCRQDGGQNRAWVLQCLKRLGGSQLICNSTGKGSVSTEWGRLITVRADSRIAHITLSDDIRELYKAGYTGINWTERQQLSPLGKWLHAFYSSHSRAPLPLKIQTIRRLSGRTLDATHMGSTFSKTLAAALEELESIVKWRCSIEDGKVLIRKPDDGIGGNARTVADYRERVESGDWQEEI